MVRTVLEQESDLLSEQEVNALEHFSKLCCEQFYLFNAINI